MGGLHGGKGHYIVVFGLLLQVALPFGRSGRVVTDGDTFSSLHEGGQVGSRIAPPTPPPRVMCAVVDCDRSLAIDMPP